MTKPTVLLPVLALLLAVTACGETSEVGGPQGSPSELRFVDSGACGDAFFWATTADDRHAIVVSTDQRERSTTRETVLEVDLSDPAFEATWLEGSRLSTQMCNDLPESEVTGRTPLVEGSGTMRLGAPSGEYDEVAGRLDLEGLVAEDGTELGDLSVVSTSIGFYAG